MADVKMYTNAGTYPVVELTGINNTGVDEILTTKKATAFTTALMNGMCVTMDERDHTVTLPSAGTAKVVLHASVEKIYGSNEARSDFAILDNNGFLPRCYRLKQGHTFETNAVIYDTTVFADYSALRTYLATSTNHAYVYPDATGLWRVVKTLPVSPNEPVTYGEISRCITLPNGENGVEIIITKVTY